MVRLETVADRDRRILGAEARDPQAGGGQPKWFVDLYRDAVSGRDGVESAADLSGAQGDERRSDVPHVAPPFPFPPRVIIVCPMRAAGLPKARACRLATDLRGSRWRAC